MRTLPLESPFLSAHVCLPRRRIPLGKGFRSGGPQVPDESHDLCPGIGRREIGQCGGRKAEAAARAAGAARGKGRAGAGRLRLPVWKCRASSMKPRRLRGRCGMAPCRQRATRTGPEGSPRSWHLARDCAAPTVLEFMGDAIQGQIAPLPPRAASGLPPFRISPHPRTVFGEHAGPVRLSAGRCRKPCGGGFLADRDSRPPSADGLSEGTSQFAESANSLVFAAGLIVTLARGGGVLLRFNCGVEQPGSSLGS